MITENQFLCMCTQHDVSIYSCFIVQYVHSVGLVGGKGEGYLVIEGFNTLLFSQLCQSLSSEQATEFFCDFYFKQGAEFQRCLTDILRREVAVPG